MQLTNILNILLSTSLVSSIPLVKRDTPQILTDISTIGSEVSALTNDVTSYNGSSSQTEPLLQHFEDLKNSISTTTSDIEAAGTLSQDDSTSISSAVTDVTSPVITLLVGLMNKGPTVDAAGYKSVVLDALNELNTETTSLFNALEDEMAIDSFASISASQEQISAALADAITDYS